MIVCEKKKKKEQSLNIEGFLIHDIYYDIGILDLFSELKVLKEILQIEESATIDTLNYRKSLDSFPYAYITYRILLTISAIIASA
jgi:hypothetical protein